LIKAPITTQPYEQPTAPLFAIRVQQRTSQSTPPWTFPPRTVSDPFFDISPETQRTIAVVDYQQQRSGGTDNNAADDWLLLIGVIVASLSMILLVTAWVVGYRRKNADYDMSKFQMTNTEVSFQPPQRARPNFTQAMAQDEIVGTHSMWQKDEKEASPSPAKRPDSPTTRMAKLTSKMSSAFSNESADESDGCSDDGWDVGNTINVKMRKGIQLRHFPGADMDPSRMSVISNGNGDQAFPFKFTQGKAAATLQGLEKLHNLDRNDEGMDWDDELSQAASSRLSSRNPTGESQASAFSVESTARPNALGFRHPSAADSLSSRSTGLSSRNASAESAGSGSPARMTTFDKLARDQLAQISNSGRKLKINPPAYDSVAAMGRDNLTGNYDNVRQPSVGHKTEEEI